MRKLKPLQKTINVKYCAMVRYGWCLLHVKIGGFPLKIHLLFEGHGSSLSSTLSLT